METPILRGVLHHCWFQKMVCLVESGCVTLQSLVLSISIICKDLWKLLHDINTSVLTEWNYERISYKPYVTKREIPRINHLGVRCRSCNVSDT
jgi:hypothetical protein